MKSLRNWAAEQLQDIRWHVQDYREEFPGGVRQIWAEMRADRADRRRFRALPREERELIRMEQAADALVMDTGRVIDPAEASVIMSATHGEDLRSVQCTEGVIVVTLRGGRIVEYDAAYRRLS